MKDYEIWFIYYDALFLNETPKLSSCFYENHWITEATWNNNCCSPLALAFKYLQEFIKDQGNWISSECTREELQCIETEINDLLCFLLIEKSYSYLFWKNDSRRVEASLVHMYTFLQMFVKCLIPHKKMTIFQCKATNKLCVQISKLEKLINQILKCINPIASYLSAPKFDQEQPIINNFFENLIVFMKKLPHIRRNKLNHVHNLVKFIHLSNPIEMCSSTKKFDLFEGNRKKSNSERVKLKLKPKAEKGAQGHHSFKLTSTKKIQTIEKRSFSFQQQRRNKNYQTFQVPNNSKIFQFTQKVKQNKKSFCTNQKTEVLKQKISIKQVPKCGLSKNLKTLTDATTTILTESCLDKTAQQEGEKKKTKSFAEQRSLQKTISKRPTNSSIRVSKGKTSKFYDAEYEKQVEKRSNLSEKQFSIRKKEFTAVTILSSEIKMNCVSPAFHLEEKKMFEIKTGSCYNSKWDFVRAYVNQRINLRKINKLFSDWK